MDNVHHCSIRVAQVTEIGQSCNYGIVQRGGGKEENDVPTLAFTRPITGMCVWSGFLPVNMQILVSPVVLYLVTIRLVVPGELAFVREGILLKNSPASLPTFTVAATL